MRRYAMSAIAVAIAAATLAAQPPMTERTVSLDLPPNGRIFGSLAAPGGGGRTPLVIIIAGSGPTDRDGNSAALPGKNNAYKMLAEALASRGIASLRYDKRGIAASAILGLKESDLRFEDYASDAAGWVTQLKQDTHFTSVTLVGHSEGSLLGMLAARKAGADGFVSLEGPAKDAADVLREQLRPQIGSVPALWDANEKVLTTLQGGQTVDPLPAPLPLVSGLAALYRASVQPYLISWFKYTPTVEVAKLTMPVLLIQGTTDIQVPPADVDALKAARPQATVTVVQGMNHVLKHVDGDAATQAPAYSDPTLPIAPEVPDAIATFVRALPVH